MPSLRLLPLLLFYFLCTCVSAQTSQPLTGSGSIIVEIEDGSWFVTISTADTNETHGFVTQSQYRLSPQTYVGYQTVADQPRHHLAEIHQLINAKLALGWQLVSCTPVQLEVPVGFDQASISETLYYTFLVPASPTKKIIKEEPPELVMASNALQSGKQLLVANIFKQSDGRYLFNVKERVGDRWLENFRLENAGLLAGDTPERIKKIHLTRDRVTFEVHLANGVYRYSFTTADTPEYFLSRIGFKAKEACGITAYNLVIPSGSIANFQAKYLEAPCAPEDKGKQYAEVIVLPRHSMRDFVPGAYNIDLKKLPARPIY